VCPTCNPTMQQACGPASVGERISCQ
jgi:hypothetical protein